MKFQQILLLIGIRSTKWLEVHSTKTLNVFQLQRRTWKKADVFPWHLVSYIVQEYRLGILRRMNLPEIWRSHKITDSASRYTDSGEFQHLWNSREFNVRIGYRQTLFISIYVNSYCLGRYIWVNCTRICISNRWASNMWESLIPEQSLQPWRPGITFQIGVVKPLSQSGETVYTHQAADKTAFTPSVMALLPISATLCRCHKYRLPLHLLIWPQPTFEKDGALSLIGGPAANTHTLPERNLSLRGSALRYCSQVLRRVSSTFITRRHEMTLGYVHRAILGWLYLDRTRVTRIWPSTFPLFPLA